MPLNIKSVLVTDGVGVDCKNILTEHGIACTQLDKLTTEQLEEELKKHDAFVVRSKTQVTEKLIAAAPNLKVIARAGAGVDNINVAAATKQNIVVLKVGALLQIATGNKQEHDNVIHSQYINTIDAPGANALSACEMTCALMMSIARHVPAASSSMRKGAWDRNAFLGTELNGKVLAILGLGRVGRLVAERMHAFGMEVIGYDPIVTAEDCKEFHTTKMELDEIWPLANYITLHTPLLDSTRNLISAEVLKKCKAGVKIINVGRGGLIEESALLEALKSQKVGGAGLDVFNEEPPTNEITLQLIQHPRVIATPHLGASTVEAQQRVAAEVAYQLASIVYPGKFKVTLSAVNRDKVKLDL